MITRIKNNTYLTIYGTSFLLLIMIWGGPELYKSPETNVEVETKVESEVPIVYTDSASSGPIEYKPKTLKPEVIIVPPKVKQIEEPLNVFSFIKEITSTIIAFGNIILIFYQIREKKKIVNN